MWHVWHVWFLALFPPTKTGFVTEEGIDGDEVVREAIPFPWEKRLFHLDPFGHRSSFE